MIGLLKVIRGYDKNRLASFKTFASICIKTTYNCNKSANSQKNIALNTAVDMLGPCGDKDDGKEMCYYTKGLESYVSYSPEELYITKEQIEGLRGYLKENLSGFEFEVLTSW